MIPTAKATRDKGMPDKLAWYYHRLRAMSLGEVVHRTIESFKRRQSRHVRPGWEAFDMGDGPVPVLPPAAGQLDTISGETLVALNAACERALRGGLLLLGQTWPRDGGPARWHLDPVTGHVWPWDQYCFDIAYRHERQRGDIKYVWEFNRLQYLQPVAACASRKRDAALARFCLAEIESWIDANPPFLGVNWASGIELALRIISILVVWAFVGEDHATPEQRRKVRACLNAHAYWLGRYPSRFSSANNHLVAECGALFLLGSLWPELGLDETAEAAKRTLCDEAGTQIHEDGVGAEQSPTYTAFTLEWYLLCLRTAEQLGVPFPSRVKDRLAKAGVFLRTIMDEADNVPRIGDDDEGRVLASPRGEGDFYVATVLSALAETLKRPDLAPPQIVKSFRGLFFGCAKAASPGPEGVKSFPEGGYTVFRRKIEGRNTLMVVDHGPLGHLSIAAHGHADALAIWLHIDGQPVLIDAGTYLYHSGGPWRDRFRGTALHNTLCLDGQDSSQTAGAFNWSKKAHCRRIGLQSGQQGSSVTAQHDGYKRSHGVLHQRQVFASQSGFVVRDALIEARIRRQVRRLPRSIEVGFLVCPDLDVVVEGHTAKISRNQQTLLLLRGAKYLLPRVALGEQDPVRGWHSERFGAMAAAPQVIFEARDVTRQHFEVELEVIGQSWCDVGKADQPETTTTGGRAPVS